MVFGAKKNKTHSGGQDLEPRKNVGKVLNLADVKL